ncbi:DNA-dependent RNA polymerase subunit epsilon [Desertibacillus haloalkaliphilus]|uniref:DNA-dependent RNA polymerase subunit epsilon n=1 Tax=Desertibacillus haloalkaliphilus TaxID=1328930 RepID=UPI001C25C1D7|nr:DNA-directed RNA polymerase subunit epsilon [Desertibacillus haloalkaliphilus]MBU8906760.1 DNA-dependent RNA polymerase auxiliary subunit epsilon family protein [Desertibacillus haloalkaliphilus]
MIYKVYYQDSFDQVPVRENTHSLFIEADSVRDVRRKLAEKNYNIEFISPLTGAYLDYEQQKEDFKVETF